MSEFEKMSYVHDLMREHLTNISKENNNSFAYLEKSTLNLLIAYLISDEKKKPLSINHKKIDRKIIKQLDKAIGDSKEQFEEVIRLLEKLS
ncbi:hypothetical protein [Rummeliibacillus stabekisii]|uniref:Uncharacterized protein n=1 Tax=Rummeliibacillus stabekisii TaxID=241244 RepID=A0A143HC98_9BACL|nr:hypothetical protein [Rummeliibacillus stabekisii]AMW99049.1 hypothetical protein ATY39_06005 [Rummeliibacillus stabekisii]